MTSRSTAARCGQLSSGKSPVKTGETGRKTGFAPVPTVIFAGKTPVPHVFLGKNG
jgi:hypothetical protein